MSKYIWAAMIVVTTGAVSGLQAQPPGPGRPLGLGPVTNPTVSPYLNLLRPGSSPAINYYGLVRPQVDFQQSIQALQMQMSGVQQTQDMMRGMDAGATGHPVYFLNYGGYFQTTTGGRPVGTTGVGVGNRTGTGINVPGTATGYGIARPSR
jgi:hypothetical protein